MCEKECCENCFHFEYRPFYYLDYCMLIDDYTDKSDICEGYMERL